MLLSTRWLKVLRDLWSNKTRTALVVLSIAVGVFAIGMIAGSRVIILRDMSGGYVATNPASATLTTDLFGDDLVEVVRRMPGVADAEARREITVRASVGPDTWNNLQLIVIPDYHQVRINTVRPLLGAWPPARGEVLLERASLDFVQAQLGKRLSIKTLDGKEHQLKVSGLVFDASRAPPFFSYTGYGYISLDTLEGLGEPRDFNQLNIVVAERPLDQAHIREVAGQVRDKIERSQRTVFGMSVPTPRKHPIDDAVQALILLLGVLGVCSLFLSGFLVVNTIGALLTQQIRQIGVMKAIGARTGVIMAMYLAMVSIFGLLALLVAVPLGALGAWAFSGYMAGLLNFDITRYSIPASVLVLQSVAGLLVPLLAALVPVSVGSRVTIREALGGYGLGRGRFGTGWIDRLLERIRYLSRPMLLSLRNTFRRKGRLALTLTTLTLAGAIFIAVLSVRESVQLTLNDVFAYYDTDIVAFTNRLYRPQVLADALRVPGVAALESWSTYDSRRLRADGSESDSLLILSMPAQTHVFHPKIIAGRWLLPDDENAVVVNTALQTAEPDIKLGDTIVLKVSGRKLSWRIVGIAQVLLGDRGVYVNQPYFGRAVGEGVRVNYLHLVTTQHDLAFQEHVVRALEPYFEHQGVQINRLVTAAGNRASAEAQFNIIIALLLIMAFLLAVVGGLGLTGTMSINVIERTREIGVMRAIGASNGDVLRIVIVEGVLIGVISWVLATIVALPISKLLSDAVGVAFVRTPLSYTFSVGALLIWLGGVILLAALASFLPARNAMRLTVRDVLAYEG